MIKEKPIKHAMNKNFDLQKKNVKMITLKTTTILIRVLPLWSISHSTNEYYK